jgi:hypothetical protein
MPASRTPLTSPIPLRLTVLCAMAFHGPLLMMQLPANSFDANFHMSMAAHYAHHWFDPWNQQALAGFSQTTYPPLMHQWTALFSFVIGITNAFMLVQGIVILLLPVAVYYFSKLWISDRAASYAAFSSIFLGSLCSLVYLDGQIGTTSATTLFLLALPCVYRYAILGKPQDLLLGLVISCTAAAAHHATLLFGIVFFAVPVGWLILLDHQDQHPEMSALVPIKRMAIFSILALAGIFVTLLPYFAILLKNPIVQTPIPHLSRANFILQPVWGLHYWLVPFGAVVLSLPYIVHKGAERRLRPLLFGFYFALLFGLGGTTPLPRLVLGRAFFVLTFERFTFWALLLAMPFVGLLAVDLIDRFAKPAAVALILAAIGSASLAIAWNVYFPLIAPPLNVDPVIKFLNEKDHDQYRYLTLGFGNSMSKISSHTNAPSIDGEYNSGRTLPEMTSHASAQLSSAKFYGLEGMQALSAILRHAQHYGVKYVFVHDKYYEPLLTFAGWRQVDSYDDDEITLWVNNAINPAREVSSPLRPPVWQGLMWGTVPFGVCLFTILLAFIQMKESRGLALSHAGPREVVELDRSTGSATFCKDLYSVPLVTMEREDSEH